MIFDEEIEIISLQKSTIDDIVKGFENYKEELNNIFNEDKLIEQFRILQNENMNDLEVTFNLDNFGANIYLISSELKEECKKLINQREEEFKNKIPTIISNNFVQSLELFMNDKGNDYLEKIFYENFIINFINDLNHLKISINQTHY